MKLLKKDLMLATSPLSWCFTAFGLMALIPGYPILVGAFFVSLGIYQSFQYAREANDILYSALLPIRKRDVVKTKYLSTVMFQLLSFVLFALCTAMRMTVWKNAAPYAENPLMAANFMFLGFVLLIYTAFNTVFLGGFFKTAYYFGKSFVMFIVAAFLIVAVGEALHHFPGLEALNAFGTEHLPLQMSLLALGIAAYALITWLSFKGACRSFEKIDL